MVIWSEFLIKNPFPLQSGQSTIPYFSGAKFLSMVVSSLIFKG
jgi:hypothetical protein